MPLLICAFIVQARVISFYEEKSRCSCIYGRYYGYLRNNCNPLVQECDVKFEDIALPDLKVMICIY